MQRLFAAVAALAALYAIAAAGAGAATTITVMPSSFTFLDGCSGEQVFVSGEIRFIVTSNITDNTISGTFHSIFRATGIGLTSGLTYQETVEANSAFESSLENGEATRTFEGLISVVAPGGDNNYTSPIFFHTTINANGDVTSVKTEAPSIICR